MGSGVKRLRGLAYARVREGNADVSDLSSINAFQIDRCIKER